MKAAARAAAGDTRDVNDVPWVKRKNPKGLCSALGAGVKPDNRSI